VTALSETLILPLDRARTALFARASRVGVLRAVVLKKERRVVALLLAHASLALVLALFAPTFLLVMGPLALGVPHLVSDVRQLVLRPRLPRLARPLLLYGSLLLLGARALEAAGVPGMARTELALAGALVLAAIALASAGAPAWRGLCAAAAAVGLVICALLWPEKSRLLLGHGHNLVALALWAALYARVRRSTALVVGVVTAVAALLVGTPLAWFCFQHGAQSAFGLHGLAAADTLAPGIQSAPLALGIVSSFAFLQAVHYAVWLHAIPQHATRGDATLSFRMSFRALRGDLGPLGLAVAVGAVLLVALGGALAPLPTKSLYLSFSAFHGYLELAAAGLFFVRGSGRSLRRLKQPTDAAARPGFA
jgi:hypothetical protein